MKQKQDLKGKVRIDFTFFANVDGKKNRNHKNKISTSIVWKGETIDEEFVQELSEGAADKAAVCMNADPDKIFFSKAEERCPADYDYCYNQIDVHFYYQINKNGRCSFAHTVADDVSMSENFSDFLKVISATFKKKISIDCDVDIKDITQITKAEFELYQKISGEQLTPFCD